MSLDDFATELTTLLNKHSQENGSNTPDFILAQYLISCLQTWNLAVECREVWYGRGPTPAPATIAAQLNRPPAPDDPASPPPITSEAFDAKFDAGEDVTEHLDVAHARRVVFGKGEEPPHE